MRSQGGAETPRSHDVPSLSCRSLASMHADQLGLLFIGEGFGLKPLT